MMDTTMFRRQPRAKAQPKRSVTDWALIKHVQAKQAAEQRFTDLIAEADAVEKAGDPERAAQMRYDALFAE